jgi:hypothetical protein
MAAPDILSHCPVLAIQLWEHYLPLPFYPCISSHLSFWPRWLSHLLHCKILIPFYAMLCHCVSHYVILCHPGVWECTHSGLNNAQAQSFPWRRALGEWDLTMNCRKTLVTETFKEVHDQRPWGKHPDKLEIPMAAGHWGKGFSTQPIYKLDKLPNIPQKHGPILITGQQLEKKVLHRHCTESFLSLSYMLFE